MEKISDVLINNINKSNETMTRRDFLGKVGALVTASTLLPIHFGKDMELMSDHPQVYSAEKPMKDSYRQLRSEYPNIYRLTGHDIKDVFVTDSKSRSVATDGFSITHILDDIDGKYKHLEKNEFLEVSPKARMNNVLDYLTRYEYGIVNPDKSITRLANPYNLDLDEVAKYKMLNQEEAKEYEKNGKGWKSFAVANNSNGEPCLIIASNPTSKLTKENGGVNAVLKAIDRLNKYDPEIMDKITLDYMVRVISGNASLFKLDHKSTTYSKGGAIIFNNQFANSEADYYTIALLIQSRYVGHKRSTKVEQGGREAPYLYDRMMDNAFKEAPNYVIDWLKKRKDKIPQSEYNMYLAFANEIKKERE